MKTCRFELWVGGVLVKTHHHLPSLRERARNYLEEWEIHQVFTSKFPPRYYTKYFTPKQEEDMINYYLRGGKIKDLAVQYGVCKQTISKFLNERKVKRLPIGDSGASRQLAKAV